MKRETIKNILLMIVTAAFVFQSFQISSLKSQMEEIRSQVLAIGNNVRNTETSLRNEFSHRLNEIDEQAKKDASLFSDTEIVATLSGADIVLNLKAIPKEIRNDETLVFKIDTGEKVLEVAADQNYQAQTKISMTPSVQVLAVFQSESGVRQETFEPIDTAGLFTLSLSSVWGDEGNSEDAKWGYTVWLEPDWTADSLLPFDPKQVEKAEFVIHNSGIQELSNDGSSDSSTRADSIAAAVPYYEVEDVSYVFDENFGERIEAIPMHGSNQKRAGYYVELAEVRDARKNGIRYNIYFCITTKDGTRFATPDHAVASFAVTEKSSSLSSGDGIMLPVFEAGK